MPHGPSCFAVHAWEMGTCATLKHVTKSGLLTRDLMTREFIHDASEMPFLRHVKYVNDLPVITL